MKFRRNISKAYQVIEPTQICDGQTDGLTFGFLLGSYSVRKRSQESVSTQQIPDNYYGINLI